MKRRGFLKGLIAAPVVVAAPPPPVPTVPPDVDPVAADLARLPDPRDDIVGFLNALDRDPALRARLAGLAVPVFPCVTAADLARVCSDEIEPLFGRLPDG